MLVWREELIGGRIREWVGPFENESVSDILKLAKIRLEENTAKPFSYTLLKNFLLPDQPNKIIFSEFQEALKQLRSDTTTEESDKDIFMTEILHPHDLCATSPEKTVAKKV